jgi:hypothetical protein
MTEVAVTFTFTFTAFECWLYQDGRRHMGKVEMVRGAFGLGGVIA